MKRMIVLVVVALLLQFNSYPAEAVSSQTRVVNIVRTKIGSPYVYGATGPNRFDCSGLVYYAYRHAGITRVKRTASQQAAQARRIPRKAMQPGDLVFFYRGIPTALSVYHVGVFVGRKAGRVVIIHAPYPGKRVRTEVPWTSRWFAGTFR